jgi:hypothetical protein
VKFRPSDEQESERKPRPRPGILQAEYIAAIIALVLVLITTAGFSWWIFMSSPDRSEAPQAAIEEEPPADTTLIDPMLPPSGPPAGQDFPEPALPPPPAVAPLPAPVPPPAPAPEASNAPAPAAPVFTQPAAPLDRTSQLRRFVTEFDGGDCFFALPVSISETSATIEAFSVAVAGAQALDRSFLQANGFEAHIRVRPVTPAQCPAVEFVRQFARNLDAAPGLALDTSSIRGGEMLTGTVTPVLDGAISVLVIRENGDVQNFSGSVSPTRRPAHFGLALQGSGTGTAETFLLMVLASGAPLPTLADGGPLPAAAELFPRLSQEAQTTPGMAVALAYGKIDG